MSALSGHESGRVARHPGRTDGSKDWVCRYNTQFSNRGEITADGKGWYFGTHWPVGTPRDIYLKLDAIDYDALLARHSPRLLYDGDEDFHALSPAAATDFFADTGDPEDSNQLEDASGVFATANPLVAFGAEDLNLDYLDSAYAGDGRRGGTPATSADFISERGDGKGPDGIFFTSDGYDSDAAQMEARPGYSNRTYGRVAHGGDGKLWLQYWFYYYFDSQGDFGEGVHEGDWEMIQVGLDASLQPDVAAYAQHGSGERCDWTTQLESTNGQPTVYVAQGSHASYFRSGHYDDPDPDDDANGDGLDATPTREQITSESPSWVAWPGTWGDSDDSPGGPISQGDKWDNPSAWAGGLAACDVG